MYWHSYTNAIFSSLLIRLRHYLLARHLDTKRQTVLPLLLFVIPQTIRKSPLPLDIIVLYKAVDDSEYELAPPLFLLALMLNLGESNAPHRNVPVMLFYVRLDDPFLDLHKLYFLLHRFQLQTMVL